MQTIQQPYTTYEKYFKRPLDIVCVVGIVLCFGWMFILVALLVRIQLGSPILFKQQRPGKDEKIFTLYKFRTMTAEKDKNGKLLPDSKRLTKFGKFLRSTSLDELPEVFNILKGEMSLVGPRPLLIQYLNRYTVEQHKRHNIRPGITGLAQVCGRNLLSWDEKFKLDVYYAYHITFIEEVKIIIKTILTVFKREGISSNTHVTMEEFRGVPYVK